VKGQRKLRKISLDKFLYFGYFAYKIQKIDFFQLSLPALERSAYPEAAPAAVEGRVNRRLSMTDSTREPSMKKLGVEHENLDHKVHRQVKSMILEQKLKPGTKIYQEKLAQDLGISRTPLVNALKKLEQQHLIIAIPRRGFFVRYFSKQEMIRIFELREVLEGLAARRASLHISDDQIHQLQSFFKGLKVTNHPKSVEKYAEEDRRFHNFLIDIGGDELLSSILETYSIVTSSYLGGFRGGLVRPPQETLPEHLAMIEAIARKEPEKAEQAARLHLRR
jgi:DNA-binding GntR family transcriptional regulator